MEFIFSKHAQFFKYTLWIHKILIQFACEIWISRCTFPCNRRTCIPCYLWHSVELKEIFILCRLSGKLKMLVHLIVPSTPKPCQHLTLLNPALDLLLRPAYTLYTRTEHRHEFYSLALNLILCLCFQQPRWSGFLFLLPLFFPRIVKSALLGSRHKHSLCVVNNKDGNFHSESSSAEQLIALNIISIPLCESPDLIERATCWNERLVHSMVKMLQQQQYV